MRPAQWGAEPHCRDRGPWALFDDGRWGIVGRMGHSGSISAELVAVWVVVAAVATRLAAADPGDRGPGRHPHLPRLT